MKTNQSITMKNNLSNQNYLYFSLRIGDLYYLMYTAIFLKSKLHKWLKHWVNTNWNDIAKNMFLIDTWTK